MPGWECAIGDCAATYDDVTDLLAHQVEGHGRHECRVCNAVVPEGFFAIAHAFDAHTRADYVRAYDADADDIRVREDVKGAVEDAVDVAAVRERLDLDAREDGTGEAVEADEADDTDGVVDTDGTNDADDTDGTDGVTDA
ncbi:hypothetical protein GCM10009037_13660 [Halarchaeum grantii]|uniref:C2H2-type domain-containing protein n=1 Tax=Halarchaeum grantii TaxID=1193105 RepID=A0A830F1U8_9EURY|nr:hypothetical protein [Halarchaeum grantii]GGL31194.1 hypothetical protein GCM10009037_13660 [Halarchaeum grantii]